MKKIAIICFNLGGPDTLAAVKPFLFNLFNDKAIISAPQPIRWLLAKLISGRRAPIAKEIYQQMGGKSPILQQTQQQAAALEQSLNTGDSTAEYKSFIAMRYWHPLTHETMRQVQTWQPEHIVLMPLYPQFSTTTTGSFITLWRKLARKNKLAIPTSMIGCYPAEETFIAAHVEKILAAMEGLEITHYRLLFSAHGLPEKIINKGDPYQWQVEQTVKSVATELQEKTKQLLDYAICYQSRVGPLVWIGPSTEEEIYRAGKDGKNIIMIPIAFVSEHSETLVELDIEYRDLAKEQGINHYIRVKALADSELYIKSLTHMVYSVKNKCGILAHANQRICPEKFNKCICNNPNV